MDKRLMNQQNEMSDDEMNNVIGGLRGYGSVPNRSVAERTANLKCSRCGARIVYSNKSSYKTIGGEIVCKNCCE